MEINGIISTAPLFSGAGNNSLSEIMKHLGDASYHYADDSGKEWDKARQHIEEAARIVNSKGLSYRAIKCLYIEESPLMTFDEFLDAILNQARK